MAQTEIGNRYALAAMKDQRARLAGEIITLERRLLWAKEQVRHVDAALQLLDPQLLPHLIPAKRPQKRMKLFRQGELSQLVRDALRQAGKPVGTHDVLKSVMDAGGYSVAASPAMAHRVRASLEYLRKCGKVTSTGACKTLLWSLNG